MQSSKEYQVELERLPQQSMQRNRGEQLNGKYQSLFKKIRHTKETFLAKMGSIKNRNGMDLTEAEDIKRSQEYTEELYKKHFHDLDNHNGVITQSDLEPDILE